MMNCNWLVAVAVEDRKALIRRGWDKAEVDKMDHKEVIAALKANHYKWKEDPERAVLRGGY